jgi:hypothetical protein
VFGGSEPWYAGFDEWHVRIGVSWYDEDGTLPDVVFRHLGDETTQVDDALAAHGVEFDDEGYAWIGEQTLLSARLRSSPTAGSRRAIRDARGLLDAADEVAGDLEELVAPLVVGAADDDWSPAVIEVWPDAIGVSSVLLLRTARTTPVLRGHLLGAWAAAQSIELFDDGSTLVATKAAPLARQDAVPDLDPDQHELTSAQTTLWEGAQVRITRHWRTHLGLTPLPDNPSILTWHTMYRNDTFEETRALWG